MPEAVRLAPGLGDLYSVPDACKLLNHKHPFIFAIPNVIRSLLQSEWGPYDDIRMPMMT